jgi:hypothetical protein
MKSLIALVLVVSSVSLAAAPRGRASMQQARINQGVNSGALTGPEAARLQAQQNQLDRQRVRDRLDGGGMTASEATRLDAKQDRLSHRIAVQKHDAQRRF